VTVCEPVSRSRPRALVARVPALSDPLLRNGHTLTLSSGFNGAVGLAYWAVVARRYSPATVGRNSAAVSAMMLLGGVAQLNLMSALVRFVPTAGARTRRLVVTVYATSISVALVVGACFLLVVGHIAPGLQFLVASPLIAVAFVLSAMAWSIFVLQDSVLVGLRKTPWVALENAVFAVIKVGLVVILARSLPHNGIFLSWSLGLVGSLALTNGYLFRRAIPAFQAASDRSVRPASVKQIARFAGPDYLGSLFWIAATTGLPIMVINEVGPAASAYFSVAWLMSFSLYAVSANMGSSLVVETAADQSRLAERCDQVLRHTLKALSAAAAVLFVGAPYFLRIFGGGYGRAGTGVLRLLALSTVPGLVTAVAVSAARAQRRTGLALVILATTCGLVLILSALLLPRIGVVAVGVAWLVTQSAAAVVLLARRSLWLPADPADIHVAARLPARSRAWLSVMIHGGRLAARWPATTVLARVRRSRQLRSDGSRAGETVQALSAAGALSPVIAEAPEPLSTVTDMTVAVLGRAALILKMPRSEHAAAELRSEHAVLATLHGDDRLGDWRRLLPQVVAACPDSDHPYAVETRLPGVDGREVLNRWPAAASAVIAAALTTIAELHQRTRLDTVVDAPLLADWVDRPLAVLAGSPARGRLGAWRRDALCHLQEELHAGLTGWSTGIGWVHGDFTPGNVLFTPDGRQVTGIVDWGQARPHGLLALDALLLVLASRCQLERCELGEATVRTLRGDWATAEQAMLTPAGILPRDLAPVRRQSLIWLCWLHHVSNNVAKSQRYQRQRYWLAANVDAVLAGALP
jgi:O-antigen/teichoic acid export membrane protein/aminoglycoside phosphotransferase (APT) family kinase protein